MNTILTKSTSKGTAEVTLDTNFYPKGNEMTTFSDTNIDGMIADSIREQRIVTVEERIDTEPWVNLVDGLAVESDDWVRITRGDARINESVKEVREYWGVDADGDEWRIHVYGI